MRGDSLRRPLQDGSHQGARPNANKQVTVLGRVSSLMASPAQTELTELNAELRRFEEVGGGVSDLRGVIAGTRSALLAFEGDVIKTLKDEELEATWTSNLGDLL